MNFSILPLEKQELNKEKILKLNNDWNFIEFNHLKNNDFLFVFGGDGTFLKILPSWINKKVKIILINEGRVGFLSSIESKEFPQALSIINNEDFSKFYYLNLFDGTTNYIALNEILIESNHLSHIDSFINEFEFLHFYCSRIFFINNIGSTGLARSFRYPILLRNNNSYIVDILDSPQYNYNKSLNQPIIFNNKEKFTLLFRDKKEITLLCDNSRFNSYGNKLIISLQQSKCSIWKFDKFSDFISKIKRIL